MNRLFLYGAGAAGRELAFALSLGSEWEICGFIDDTPELQGRFVNGIPVLGGVDYLRGLTYLPKVAVCITGNPAAKRKAVERIKAVCQVGFPLVVSPHSYVSRFVEWGEGCVIANPFNYITVDVTFGAHVWVNNYTGIGHDTAIGDYTTLYTGINCGGGIRIGNDCIIGSGVTIKPGIRIGNNVIVGGGAVVVKDVPDNVVVAGNPARILKENPHG